MIDEFVKELYASLSKGARAEVMEMAGQLSSRLNNVGRMSAKPAIMKLVVWSILVQAYPEYRYMPLEDLINKIRKEKRIK